MTINGLNEPCAGCGVYIGEKHLEAIENALIQLNNVHELLIEDDDIGLEVIFQIEEAIEKIRNVKALL